MNTYKRNLILRGDILYAELGAAVGSEQAGFRPVVVVQNDVGNRYSPTVIVAPMTSNTGKARTLRSIATGSSMVLPAGVRRQISLPTWTRTFSRTSP